MGCAWSRAWSRQRLRPMRQGLSAGGEPTSPAASSRRVRHCRRAAAGKRDHDPVGASSTFRQYGVDVAAQPGISAARTRISAAHGGGLRALSTLIPVQIPQKPGRRIGTVPAKCHPRTVTRAPCSRVVRFAEGVSWLGGVEPACAGALIGQMDIEPKTRPRRHRQRAGRRAQCNLNKARRSAIRFATLTRAPGDHALAPADARAPRGFTWRGRPGASISPGTAGQTVRLGAQAPHQGRPAKTSSAGARHWPTFAAIGRSRRWRASPALAQGAGGCRYLMRAAKPCAGAGELGLGRGMLGTAP